MTHTPKTLLIIDDDSTLRLNLGAFFKDKGYEIYDAENGKIGLDVTISKKPKAILLDILMPEMDGLEYMKIVSEKHPEFLDNITLMTSSSSMKYLGDAINYGVFRYIIKGDMSLEQIFKLVDASLEK